jgi:8-oxo-dGTP diphosphatase
LSTFDPFAEDLLHARIARAFVLGNPIMRAMNCFESGQRKVIPAVLVYARSRGCVLMMHRNMKGATDVHHGKYNGLGGKLEAGESPLEAARREFHEEAGIHLPEAAFSACGVLQFPDFKPHKKEDWVVYVFSADAEPIPALPGLFKGSLEGDLHWVPEGRILDLPLWEGDRDFLPLVLAGKPFLGSFWYQGGSLRRRWLQRL